MDIAELHRAGLGPVFEGRPDELQQRGRGSGTASPETRAATTQGLLRESDARNTLDRPSSFGTRTVAGCRGRAVPRHIWSMPHQPATRTRSASRRPPARGPS